MANIYVRSTDGSDADNGSTWALAKATLAGAAGIDAAGDTVWVSQSHAQSGSTFGNMFWAGTIAAPIRILCGNDAAEPPTALATGATCTATGTSGGTVNTTGAANYIYGITFIATSTSSPVLAVGSTSAGDCRYESCNFRLDGNGTGPRISLAGGNSIFSNCGFKFANASQGISALAGQIIIRGGSLLSGGTSPTAFCFGTGIGEVVFEGFDLSNADAAINLVSSVGNSGSHIAFRNCKLPASWSGVLATGTFGLGERYELHNTDATSTNYRLWVKTGTGDVTHETTLVRTGGASDGTTPIAWKHVTSANALWPYPLFGPEIVQWNEITGSSITATIEVLHDSATALKDSEIWIEVQYLSASGTPLGTFINDGSADILATGTDQTSSSATWTTTGMSNPNTQKLSVTFTPQMKGFIHARVMVAKASYTVYVDPLITVS